MANVAKVLNYFIGKTNRTPHPATMGCEWSCNMFRESNEGVEYMASLPGLKHIKHIGSGRCRGAFVSSVGLASMDQQENCFVVFGSRLYRIDATGESVHIGNVANGSNRVSMAETGGVSPYLLVADGYNLFAYDLLNGGSLIQCSLPQAANGDSAIRPTFVTVVHGSIIVNDAGSGMVYYSQRYPLTTPTREVYQMQDGSPVYDPNNPLKILTQTVSSFDWLFYDLFGVQQFITTYTSSDAVKAIYGLGERLYLFGSHSVEIWQHGSTEASQTWTMQSYTTNADNGIQAPNTVAGAGGVIYYLGSGQSFSKGILLVEGSNFRKISEDWLDAKLMQETSESAYAYSYAMGNHKFYCLFLPTVGECWTYDADTKEWAQRVSRNRDTGVEQMWRPQALVWFKESFWAFCGDGWAYDHNVDYFWEDFRDTSRLPMTRHRQGAVIVDGNRNFRLQEVAIECNVGTWDDYELSPYAILEVSRDGGNTWGNMRQASMGLSGQYSHRVRFLGLGINRLCVLRLTYSHPTPLELTSCSVRAAPTSAVI